MSTFLPLTRKWPWRTSCRPWAREVAGEAAALPLLQFAAECLWERRDPRTRELTRAARQFLYHAHFEPAASGLGDAAYAQLVRRVMARNPRKPCAADRRIVFPGYSCLREFSRQREAVLSRCARYWSRVTEGPKNCIFRRQFPSGQTIQLDLFFASQTTRDLLDMQPGNFGTLQLCRTGSKEHNIYLVEHAKRLGLRWAPYDGVFEKGVCIASETEAAVFQALHLDFIPPERRERSP